MKQQKIWMALVTDDEVVFSCAIRSELGSSWRIVCCIRDARRPAFGPILYALRKCRLTPREWIEDSSTDSR